MKAAKFITQAKDANVDINLLAPELFFKFFQHPVYKM